MSAAFEPSPSTQIFRAYGLEHTGELSIGSERRNARIIHLSRYDARVRLQDAPVAIATHEALLLSVNPPACLRATPLRIMALVQWRQGNELGLVFRQPLELGVGELQQLLA